MSTPVSLRRWVLLGAVVAAVVLVATNVALSEALRSYLIAHVGDGGGRRRALALTDRDLDAALARLRLIQVVGTTGVLLALAGTLWLGHRVLAEVEAAFRQRAASEERVRRFAADASHELRTPLTSILGYAQLWRSGGLRDEAELDEAMRRSESAALRMAALIEDLLLLARLDQGRPLDTATIALDALVADVVAEARAIDPDRPRGLQVAPTRVVGDELRLRQVVGNLLANARVHTPPGTPVSVTVGAEGGRAVVRVADRGPGLPPGVGERVFERFYRADAGRARATGGSGLGLSIVAALVRAHRGSISVTSAPGQGCTFTVALPLAAAPQPASPARSASASSSGGATSPAW